MEFDRVIRFVAKEDGKTYYGEPTTADDIGELYHARQEIQARILTGSPLSPAVRSTDVIRTVDKLLSPLDRDEIKTIRGMGAQFGDVAKPDVPVVFYKPATALAGPEDPILVPEEIADENNDYEVELCVVMGRAAKDVTEAEALDYVLGYATVNDVSSRKLCAKAGQWAEGKHYDNWCPLGPTLVSPKYLGDPMNLRLTTYVNDVLKQDSNTGNMILNIAEIISLCSRGTTLEPGSIFLTGSPLALNRAEDPAPFLKHNDLVKIKVEKCDTLYNPVIHVKSKLTRAQI